MAKYSKKLSGAVDDENERFELSVRRLRNFINVKEYDRRRWSKENFGNPQGGLFKAVRVLIPLFSLYLFCSVFIYCYIRDVQNTLALAYNPSVGGLGFIFGYIAVMCAILFAGNVVLLFRKYYVGAALCLFSSLAVLIHILTQLNIAMPENNNKFMVTFAVSCGIYFILALLCGYILFCLLKVKRTVRKLTDEVLAKISRSTNEMLTPDKYSEKIEEYIEKEKKKLAFEVENKQEKAVFADEEHK